MNDPIAFKQLFFPKKKKKKISKNRPAHGGSPPDPMAFGGWGLLEMKKKTFFRVFFYVFFVLFSSYLTKQKIVCLKQFAPNRSTSMAEYRTEELQTGRQVQARTRKMFQHQNWVQKLR